jgi:hypothetical protein
MSIHDIGSADLAQEGSDLMRLLWSEVDDVAAARRPWTSSTTLDENVIGVRRQ